jgi:hypothetical protein
MNDVTHAVASLTENEHGLIRECLRATADGPFFPDWEFSTIMGVDRETVRKVGQDWPERTVPQVDFQCAVQNALNNLIGYPHKLDDVWSEYISASPTQVRALLYELIAKKVLH